MKTLLIAAVAALAVTACEPIHNVERLNTCAFAGIRGVDQDSCATRGSGIYNVAKASPAVVWHNPRQTVHMDANPSKHMIHGKVHYAGCKAGTVPHYHHGKKYHRMCK